MAWDNAPWPRPPDGAEYISAAGNLARQLSQMFGGLGDAYQSGQNFQYQQRQRDFFQNPDNAAMLQDALKTGNINPLIGGVIKSEGASGAAPYLQMLLDQQTGSEAAKLLLGAGNGGQPQGQNINPTAPQAGSPEQITGRPQATNYSGSSDNTGRLPTIRQMAIDSGVDPTMPGFAQAFAGTGLDRELTSPSVIAAAQKRIDKFKREGGDLPMGDTSTGTSSPDVTQRSPVPQAGLVGQDESSTGQAIPTGAMGGSGPISPAPTSASGNIGGTPARVAQATQPGTRPTPVGTEAEARQAFDTAKRQQAAAAYLSKRNPKAAESLLAAAKDNFARGEKIMESIGAYNKPTPEMMNAQASGTTSPAEFEKIKKQNELKATEFAALDKGIQAQDNAAGQSDEDMRAMRGILSDPKLFTGPGAQIMDNVRGALINAGLMDPNARLASDALKKVTAKALQAQMADMRDDAAEIGGTAGRIMLAQVNIMKDAAQNPEMSVSGLRYLTELMERTNARSHDLAQLARDYKRTHGGMLDDGFYQKRADYNRTHPLMTDKEMEHHQLMAAPHLPSSMTRAGKDEIAAWAKSQGLRPGDAIRVGTDRDGSALYKEAP